MVVEGLSENLIGKKVSIKTTSNETFEGIIYGYDQQQNCLALFEAGGQSKNRQSFRLFNASYIDRVTQTGEPTEDFFKGELPKISKEKVRDRANTAREKRMHALGQDVSIEAQDVFDAIERTLRCTWDGTTIVILDAIKLSHPYLPENLKEKDGVSAERGMQTLEQVKKILKDRQERQNRARVK
ncbi:Protein LSM12 [Diplonema papillatum]|nr:Protein LSM12 [Diplonema papillatum]